MSPCAVAGLAERSRRAGRRLDRPGGARDGPGPGAAAHVVYGRNRLFHAWYDGASWQIETIDAVGGSRSGPAIAIDDAGTITIVAYP